MQSFSFTFQLVALRALVSLWALSVLYRMSKTHFLLA
jgi:hypothetical protein